MNDKLKHQYKGIEFTIVIDAYSIENPDHIVDVYVFFRDKDGRKWVSEQKASKKLIEQEIYDPLCESCLSSYNRQ